MDPDNSRPGPSVRERAAVVVSGASSGIGETCAVQLAETGFIVFAGVRNLEDGERLAARRPDAIIPVVMDVTDRSSIQRAEGYVRENLPDGMKVRGLVNNAGISIVGPLEVLPLEDLRRQLEVNVTGQVAVTQAFLPLLRESRGRVVNMGSITGRVAFPFAGPYAASKAALATLTDSLRLEMKRWGIRVILIEPGNIKTSIWNKHVAHIEELQESLDADEKALYETGLRDDVQMVGKLQQGGASPGTVARAVRTALTSNAPKARYFVGWDARFMSLASKLVSDKVRDFLVERYLKSGG